jgi:hypothetical protein
MAAVALSACGRAVGVTPVMLPVAADALAPESEFLAQVDRSMGTRDCFTVIRDPEFLPVAQAPRMTGGEIVLGLDLASVQVAYPVNLLNLHEIVEHTLAGQELLVCW